MQKTVEIWNKKCIFSENPCAKMQKTQKSENSIGFTVKNCRKEQFCFVFLVFFAKKHPKTNEQPKTELGYNYSEG